MARALRRRLLYNPSRRRSSTRSSAPRRRRKLNPRKLSLAQKLAGFGGPRAKAAANSKLTRSRAAKKAAVTRKRTVNRHRNASRPRRRRRGNPTLTSVLPALAANPHKRKKTTMQKKRRSARRRARTRNTHRNSHRSGYFARRSNAAPRRPRRRRNPRRGYFAARRRHSNPRGGGRIFGLLTKAGYTIGGAVGTRALTQAILGQQNSGMMGYAANAAAAFILGMAGGKIFGKDAGQFITIGGFVGIVMRLIQEFTQLGKVVNLQLSGLGDYSFAGVRGLGSFEPMDYFVPLASADSRGTVSAAATPPGMIARVAQSVMPAVAANGGVSGLGRGKSRFSGSRYWGAN